MPKKDAKSSARKKEAALVAEKASSVVTAEEVTFLAKLQALVDDGNSVRGRDNKVIKDEADELEKELAGLQVSAAGRKQAKENLEEIESAAAFERNSSRFVQILMMVVMFVPMLLSLLETIIGQALLRRHICVFLSSSTAVVAAKKLWSLFRS